LIYYYFANFDIMKNYNILLLIAFCLMVLPGCRNKGDKVVQKTTDLITIKTLGLAYLEEFKLEEAEKEFLKFIDLAPKDKFGYANLGLTYLRMAKYPEAEKQLKKAIEIDPKDPDIRLILATVYKMNNERDRAITELKDALTFAPDHIKNLYEISELYSTLPDEDSGKQRENYILTLVEKAPQNLVPRLNLTDILIRNGESDKALEQLEIIRKQFPEFPKEAVEYYDKTISLLRKKDKENAIIQFTIFHNYLKVTSPYQAGVIDLKGPGGSLIGFPVITFDRQSSSSSRNIENVSLLDIIKYTNASSAAGLDIVPHFRDDGNPEFRYSTHVEACDYDGDGDIDLYAGSYDPSSSSYKHYLFNNEMGKFTDVSKEAGLKHSGKESAAAFADYDNDGFPDLFIMREGGDILYRNTGKGTFEDVTEKAKAGSKTGGKKALFFDMDHDGDLDLLEITSDSNLFLRNNGDGTFEDQSVKLGPQTSKITSTGAVFGDFDDDEDIDFVVVNKNSGVLLYSNQRQGVFKDIASECGLAGHEGAGALAAGDYNNDGYLDLFIGSGTGGKQSLLRNLRDGKFEEEKKAGEMFRSLEGVNVYDASFLDFNNDGFLDLMVAGESTVKDGKGIFLYYNDGAGNFRNVSELLPAEVKSGRQITVFDYNDDGDLDAVVAGLDGGIYLLRNDGGNNNHFISMKLVGLRAGSAKNNHFGIGAKVEIRAGDLYQTMVVTDPNIHFGIGNHARADIIRIRWTNGVPQNIFLPGSDQALIEEQTLKGSCPFLYTWNGEKYTFVKDILWRSALGMPTGIMGGTTSYAFADASDDYLKIPGEQLRTKDGSYSLQITSELWETIYMDKLELVAVDHPDSLDIFVPEQFGPPPFPGLKILKVKDKHIPVSAEDSNGSDVLSFISQKDDNYLSDFKSDKYQGITEMRDLIIDPGDINTSGRLFLFMNGWIFPTDASINVAISQSDDIKVIPPLIQVMNKKGVWETVISNLGFPMGKDKTVVADLTGKFLTKDHRIRIRTNMEIYWDQIFFSEDLPDAPAVLTVLEPSGADLHYRGFSKPYRKGGRYGPHWFDYSSVEKGPKWRDLSGNYTRFGDVTPLLLESDNKYTITNAGDEITVEFNAIPLPQLATGWKRDFLIRSVGWVKDGDLNTAFGSTVLPLPFHGMKRYPPSKSDTYPDEPDLQKYNREYNTRVVSANEYLNAVRGYEKK
jgi:tetratricopeptide (TPR) repeat protein